MRDIRVMVNNDKERDAVLKEFEREGVKWNEGQRATEYKPAKRYPYYIYRGGVITCGIVRTDSCFSGYKEVPVSTFLELDKDVITITSDGKTVTAEMGDRKGVAKCSPEDEFSLKTGAKLALDRMFKLQVGDKVKCVDGGYSYTTFVGAIKAHCDKDMCVRYAYNTNMREGEVGEVKYLLAHPFDGSLMAVVDTRGYELEEPVYLIGVKGLKKYEQQR